MLPQVQTEITTFLLDKTQKETLESIAKLHNTTTSEIIRTMITVFLNSQKFQLEILKEIRLK